MIVQSESTSLSQGANMICKSSRRKKAKAAVTIFIMYFAHLYIFNIVTFSLEFKVCDSLGLSPNKFAFSTLLKKLTKLKIFIKKTNSLSAMSLIMYLFKQHFRPSWNQIRCCSQIQLQQFHNKNRKRNQFRSQVQNQQQKNLQFLRVSSLHSRLQHTRLEIYEPEVCGPTQTDTLLKANIFLAGKLGKCCSP